MEVNGGDAGELEGVMLESWRAREWRAGGCEVGELEGVRSESWRV